MKNQEIFGNYGFFSIEPGEGKTAVIRTVDGKKRTLSCYEWPETKIIPLNSNTYLISSDYFNIFVQQTVEGVNLNEYHCFYEHETEEIEQICGEIVGVMALPSVQIESVPYKMTDGLLSQGLIVIREGYGYLLYDYVNNRVVSAKHDNIDEVDGKIVAEDCVYALTYVLQNGWYKYFYPKDILAGELDQTGSFVNGEAISQKWNIPVALKSYMLQDYDEVTSELERKNPDLEFDYEKYLADKKGGRK